MPDVSKIIKSNCAAFKIFTASLTCLDRAKLDCLVANERIKTRLFLILFILILSPKRAPPVFLFEGSTEIIPIVFCGKSIKNRLTSSSTVDDFPDPPVPVIPKTGIVD